MHVRELLDVAALVATHAATLVERGEPIPAASLERYWLASKARLDRWGHALKRFTAQMPGAAPRHRSVSWLVTRPVVEEILAGEVLTRVWTAFLTALDRRQGLQEAEPIGRSVLVGHLEARHRAMNLLIHDPNIPTEHTVALNRLRRRAERWTDLLVGRMLRLENLSEFAASPERCREFAAELHAQQQNSASELGWLLTLSAMRSAFSKGLDPLTANSDLNGAIATSILASCGPEQFDTQGLLRSSWLARLSATSNDTALMIEDLFALEQAETGSSSHAPLPHRDRYGGRKGFRL